MTCILRALVAALSLLLPVAAFGQSSVLQSGPPAPGHFPQYVGSGSQAVIMDGGGAAGGRAGINPSEFGITARGTGTPPYAGQGKGPLGTNGCFYDAPSDNATGYHWLCLSANAQGSALIASGAAGTATQQPLCFIVNGLPLCLGGSSGSAALVTATLPTTPPAVTCWVGISGQLGNCSGGAATLFGVPGAAAGVPAPFTIQGLTARGAPDPSNDKIPLFDFASGTIKYVTPAQIASSATAGVSSLGGMTGAITCSDIISCSAGTVTSAFTQTGTGAIPVTVSSLLRKVVRPEEFASPGTDICAGIVDAGPAIQRAIDSTAGPVTVSYAPAPCLYNVVTPITSSKAGVSHEGAGLYGSFIRFSPTTNASLFTVSGGAIAYYQEFRNLWVYSGDATFVKKMFVLSDVSQTLFENVHCGATSNDDSPLHGGGGATGSICLQTNGRELTTFRKSTLAADSPIVIGKNPHAAALSADHFVFDQLDLIGNGGFPCMFVEDGAGLTNLTVSKSAWNVCTNGFLDSDTTSVTGMSNVAFRDVRIEQSTAAGGFGISMSINPGVTSLRLLTIENTTFDPTQKGLFLRGVLNVTLANNFFICSPATVAIDAGGGTVDAMWWVNNFFNTTCTFVSTSGTPMIKQWGVPVSSSASQTLPASAFFLSQQQVNGVFNNMVNMPKIGSSGVAPGAAQVRIEAVAGTAGGSCKLIAYAGTSATPTTILDNIGSGC